MGRRREPLEPRPGRLLPTVLSAALALESLNFGLAAAHLVEMRPKRRLAGRDWVTVQGIYRDFGAVARFTFPAAFVAEALAATLARRRPPAALAAVAATGSAATMIIWRFLNEPVNRQVAAWTPDALPRDWERRRDQWEFAHATSAIVHAVDLGCLIAAASCRPAGPRTRASRR
jgi:hypothetical protein